MKEIAYGSAVLPRLLCGTSPFMGAGQFGPSGAAWYHQFFNHPERMAELISHFCDVGFPGAHIIAYPSIIEAARLVKEKQPFKVTASLLPDDWLENLDGVAALEPEVVFVHGSMTDEFLNHQIDELQECLQAIRDLGAFPGMATHDSYQTLRALQAEGHPLEQESFGLLLPINHLGWAIGGPLKAVLDLLEKTDARHPVMGMKVLAAGRLAPDEALDFIFRQVKLPVATVGIVAKEQAEELASICQALLSELGE
ncbi:MAG: hypothetical protein ACFFCO_09300 [Promethearchaeota archaeon]